MTSTHDHDHAVDVVLDAPASLSVYLQALARAGRGAEIDAVVRAHSKAADTARDKLVRHGAWSSVSELEMPAPHTYEPAAVYADVVVHGPADHHDLHAHLLIDSAIDLESVRRVVPLIQSRYVRVLGDALSDDLGVRVEVLGGLVQIAGVPSDLVDRLELRPCRVRAGVVQLRAMRTPTISR